MFQKLNKINQAPNISKYIPLFKQMGELNVKYVICAIGLFQKHLFAYFSHFFPNFIKLAI